MFFILKKKYIELDNELIKAKKIIKQDSEHLAVLEFKLDIANREIKHLKQNLSDTHVELIECKEYANEKRDRVLDLEYKNEMLALKVHELETELAVTKLKNEQLVDDLKDADKEVVVAKDKLDKMGKVYNSINNILWCNRESVRQLKRLHNDILDGHYSKNEIASYLNEILFRIGGESKFEYVGGVDNVDELN